MTTIRTVTLNLKQIEKWYISITHLFDSLQLLNPSRKQIRLFSYLSFLLKDLFRGYLSALIPILLWLLDRTSTMGVCLPWANLKAIHFGSRLLRRVWLFQPDQSWSISKRERTVHYQYPIETTIEIASTCVFTIVSTSMAWYLKVEVNLAYSLDEWLKIKSKRH